MKLSEKFDVSPGKVSEVLARLKRLGLDPGLIVEEFLRGGGKGGQKINKTANCVRLTYPPLDLAVRCQADRRRTVNRFLALRELADRAEVRLSPGTSKRLREWAGERRRKARRRQKALRITRGAVPS